MHSIYSRHIPRPVFTHPIIIYDVTSMIDLQLWLILKPLLMHNVQSEQERPIKYIAIIF